MACHGVLLQDTLHLQSSGNSTTAINCIRIGHAYEALGFEGVARPGR